MEADSRTTRGWINDAENRTAVGWLYIITTAVVNLFIPKFVKSQFIAKIVPMDLD